MGEPMTPEERAKLRALAEAARNTRTPEMPTVEAHIALSTLYRFPIEDVVIRLLDALDAAEQLLAAERRDADMVESELRSELVAMTERAERADRERDESRRMNDDDTERLFNALQIERELRTDLARLREAMPHGGDIVDLTWAVEQAALRGASPTAIRSMRECLARIDAVQNGGE